MTRFLAVTPWGALLTLTLLMGCRGQGSNLGTGADPGDRLNLEISTISYDPRVESLGPDGFWLAALDEGMAAAKMAQTAQSSQAWQRVAAQWQQAITSLERMPIFSDEQTEVADKITEYRSYRAIALDRALAANPQCQNVTISDTPGLALNQVRFHWLPVDPYDFGDRPEATLVGCLTNHSDLTIDHLRAGYKYISAEWGYGVGGGDVKFLGDAIAPGKTVPVVLPITADSTMSGLELNLTANETTLKMTQQFNVLPLPPAPAVPDPQANCAAVPAPDTLHQMQLHRPPADDFSFVQEDRLHLVGCLTNHSGETITQGSIDFRSGTDQGHPGFATLEIAQNEVLPGQTVAFRLFGGLERDRIYLHSLETNLGIEEIGITVGPEN
jgi:hypothetical protein